MVSKVTCPLPIMNFIVGGLWQEIKAEVEGMCLSWHHCEGKEGEGNGTKSWLPMQGGTIAPSLKLRMADAENIYHCNDKEEDEGWDRSQLVHLPFLRAEDLSRWRSQKPWAYTAPPSLSTGCPGAVLEPQLCLHKGGGLYSRVTQGWGCQDTAGFQGVNSRLTTHTPDAAIPWWPKSLQSRAHSEQSSSLQLSQGAQGAPKLNQAGHIPRWTSLAVTGF